VHVCTDGHRPIDLDSAQIHALEAPGATKTCMRPCFNLRFKAKHARARARGAPLEPRPVVSLTVLTFEIPIHYLNLFQSIALLFKLVTLCACILEQSAHIHTFIRR